MNKFRFLGTIGFIILVFGIGLNEAVETCGPRSCVRDYFCVCDYTSAVCRKQAETKMFVDFNVTTDGVWADSAQFKGSIKNIWNQKIRRLTFHADDFHLLKDSSIWNARYIPEYNEIMIPDFADWIKPEETYSFGFILSKTEKPPLRIKSVRF
eukprot:gene3839-4782_t